MQQQWREIVSTQESDDHKTILVLGHESLVFEPLYLQALARHPSCERILFAPLAKGKENKEFMPKFDELRQAAYHKFKGTYDPVKLGDPHEIEVYDITSVLREKDEHISATVDSVQSSLDTFFEEHEPYTCSLDDVHFFINGCNETFYGEVIRLQQPDVMLLNSPWDAEYVNDKSMLPGWLASKAVQPSKWMVKQDVVASHRDIGQFMTDNKLPEAVVKFADGIAGSQVFRAYRDPKSLRLHVENPKDDWPTSIRRLNGLDMRKGKWVVNEKLDVSQGDWRAMFAFGKCVGLYNRFPSEGGWMCNKSQGGKLECMSLQDISEQERSQLDYMAKKLNDHGVHFAATDWIAGHDGKRYLIEVNSGLLLSLSRLQEMGQADVCEEVANATFEHCREQQQEKYTGRGVRG